MCNFILHNEIITLEMHHLLQLLVISLYCLLHIQYIVYLFVFPRPRSRQKEAGVKTHPLLNHGVRLSVSGMFSPTQGGRRSAVMYVR